MFKSPVFEEGNQGDDDALLAGDACFYRLALRQGYSHVVDIDMEKFFDRVNHDYLMNLQSMRIRDKLVLKLIHRYLRAGAMINGVEQGANKETGSKAARPSAETAWWWNWCVFSFDCVLS